MVATISKADAPANVDEEYSVQQVAAITGMSQHNLRYYERAGLLAPVRRDGSSRHRRYTQADITRIENLACLRARGMPLEQMRQFVEDHQGQSEQVACGQVALFEAHREVLQERLRQTRRNLQYVELKATYWRAVEAGQSHEVEQIARQIRALTHQKPSNNRGAQKP